MVLLKYGEKEFDETIGATVPLYMFEQYCEDYLADKHFCFNKISSLKKYVDIDGDGKLCANDIETFLKRFSMIDYAKSEMTHSVRSF
jgi:hypothetical protein